MGGQVAFYGTIAPENVSSWSDQGRHCFVNAPTGRAMANGDTRILPTGIVMYLGGNGAARTATIYVGGASLSLGVPANNGSQAVGGSTTARNLISPGAIETGYFPSGLMYFGWKSAPGRTLYYKEGGSVSNASLAGYFDWADAPSAPTLNTPTVNDDDITITWSAPSTNGGSSILGYQLQYSQSSTFASGVTTVNLGVVTTYTANNLTKGAKYYFRVAAKNEVTNIAGTTSTWSATRSITIPSGMRYDDGSSWVDTLGWYYDTGSSWVEVDEWYYDNGSAWVALQ